MTLLKAFSFGDSFDQVLVTYEPFFRLLRAPSTVVPTAVIPARGKAARVRRYACRMLSAEPTTLALALQKLELYGSLSGSEAAAYAYQDSITFSPFSTMTCRVSCSRMRFQ